MSKLLPPLVLLGAGCICIAQEAAAPATATPATVETVVSAVSTGPASTEMPATNFYSSVAADEMFTEVRRNPMFAKLEQNLYGSPVTLRITHSLLPTAGGKASSLLSAIWSGGTLGLLPVVTNNNFVVRYDVSVQGRDIITYTYQRTFTRAINIWAEDKTYGLGEDGLAWLKSTAQQFAGDVASDGKLADLRREYDFYFGS